MRASRPRTRLARPDSVHGSASWWRIALPVGLAVAGVLALVVGVGGIVRSTDSRESPRGSGSRVAAVRPTEAETGSVASTAMAAAVARVGMIEVPDVTGRAPDEARIVLGAAGLDLSVLPGVEPTGAEDDELIIITQDPVGGSLIASGSVVAVVLGKSVPGANAAEEPDGASPGGDWVVCIDPGHQSKGESAPEPIGPGSKKTKPSVTGGATGVVTGVPEYEIALQISINLQQRLEASGVKVVMTRTTSDVNLSNSQRAEVANDAGADLFVRIHCDGSPSADTAGISTLYPASNKWTKPFAADSKRAAKRVQSSVIAATGAVDRGIVSRSDLSGFNWADMPCVLVECGFMSNPVEDRLLASPHYQDKLAAGIAQGIIEHLGEGE